MIFKKYRWSNWFDINTGTFSNYYYVLQARRRNDGKIEFRVEGSKPCYTMKPIELSDLEKVKI